MASRIVLSLAALMLATACQKKKSVEHPSPEAAHICPAVFEPGVATPSQIQTRAHSAAHAVGVTSAEFADDTRITPANGTEPEHSSRVLPAEIWYPAQADASTSETVDAPLDLSGASYPLVVFVHGSQGLRRQSAFLMRALAAHGYVVVAADFPLTYLLMSGGSSDKHVDMQVCDIAFLANRLFEMSADPSGILHGALDPSAGYAVMGHSTGGSVSLATAFGTQDHDPRVKAAIALAPCACFFSEHFFHTRPTPLMVLAGTDDGYVPPSTNGERAYSLTTGPKRLGLIKGGTHLFFTDLNLEDDADTPTSNESDISQAFLAEGPGGACDTSIPKGTDPLIAIQDQHALTIQLSTAFLDAFMYGDDAALTSIDREPPAQVTYSR